MSDKKSQCSSTVQTFPDQNREFRSFKFLGKSSGSEIVCWFGSSFSFRKGSFCQLPKLSQLNEKRLLFLRLISCDFVATDFLRFCCNFQRSRRQKSAVRVRKQPARRDPVQLGVIDWFVRVREAWSKLSLQQSAPKSGKLWNFQLAPCFGQDTGFSEVLMTKSLIDPTVCFIAPTNVQRSL